MSAATDDRALFLELLDAIEAQASAQSDVAARDKKLRAADERNRTKLREAVQNTRQAIEDNDAIAAAAWGHEVGDLSLIVDLAYLWPSFVAGRQFRAAQSAKGKARWKARDGLGELIAQLARKKDALGDFLPPNEIWPEMHSELEREGLRPKELLVPPRYKFTGGSISYEAFRKQVQRVRRTAT